MPQIKYYRLMPPKKPANTHFHKQKDNSNTKLFFLANKKTDFSWNENLLWGTVHSHLLITGSQYVKVSDVFLESFNT